MPEEIHRVNMMLFTSWIKGIESFCAFLPYRKWKETNGSSAEIAYD